MKISYDTEQDILTIQLTSLPPASCEHAHTGVILDFDQNQALCGLRILQARRRIDLDQVLLEAKQSLIKTSKTHPLRIDWVEPFDVPGRIGMTFCPGKIQKNSMSGGDWNRDQITDLGAIRDWGASMLLCLLEDHEIVELKVDSLHTTAEAMFQYFRLPIVDGNIPDDGGEKVWNEIGPIIRNGLAEGRDLVIFCKGGLGRTGTIAARLLIEFGEAPESAIRYIRNARKGAIETQAQENYLLSIRYLDEWSV